MSAWSTGFLHAMSYHKEVCRNLRFASHCSSKHHGISSSPKQTFIFHAAYSVLSNEAERYAYIYIYIHIYICASSLFDEEAVLLRVDDCNVVGLN